MYFPKRLLMLCLWLAMLTFLPSLSYAKRAAAPPPQIGNFYIAPAPQITPGTELTFTIEGTPKGKASVRISVITRTITLPEVESGVYEGNYTITSRDRLVASAPVHATLRVGSQSATRSQPLADSSPARATTSNPPATAGPLAIERFSTTPINKIEPGADLKFMLIGTPGAKAAFTIEGVAKDVPMNETKSGQYEGGYTIRRLDNFPSGVSIAGIIEQNGKTVRAQLNQPLVVAAKPPVIKNVSPREGEIVSGTPTLISGTFDDSGGVGVDIKTIKLTLAGTDVTRNAIVTPQFFTYRTDLKPGPYPVVVTGKDMSGNTVRYAWTFTVSTEAPSALPLEIVSHANNAQVESGAVTVRGRTAPDTKVDVQVQAVAALAGLFGLTQQIFNQSLRSDAAGNFSFSFQPQVPVPGTRYEININAARNDLHKETKLVLFQQK
jgi:hypothetical protein